MKALPVFLTVAILLSASVCAGQVRAGSDPLAKAEDYVRKVDRLNEAKKGPDVVIADMSDPREDEKPMWKKFPSADVFEADQATSDSYTVAFIYVIRSKPVTVNFTYSSPSGDWVQYVFHVFRPDGSLAKVDRELRTFLGDVIVNRVVFYGPSGKILNRRIYFRDLQTGKPVKPTSDFMDMDSRVYKKIAELPFADLL